MPLECIHIDLTNNIKCDKRALYNYEDAKGCRYCKNHALDNMVNKNYNICSVDGCKKRASYKNLEKKHFCGEHKVLNGESKIVNTNHKKCIKCKKSRPSFNYKDKNIPTHCNICKLDGMEDVYHKKCIKCNNKQSLYNYENETIGIYCFGCKLDGMINVITKKCIKCCLKIPSFNYKNEKTSIYCFGCKLDNMVDVRSKKCSLCQFNTESQNFKPLCFTCYRHNNPNSDFTRNYKIKENTIMKFVKDKYSNCVMDSTINGGCSRRRPDGLIEYELFSIIIEVDEDSHRSYENICENKRLMEIYKDLNFKPLRVIRFNPDEYKDINGDKIDSLFSLDSNNKLKVKNNKKLNDRVNILLKSIEKTIEDMNKEINLDIFNIKSINIDYLFFNENE